MASLRCSRRAALKEEFFLFFINVRITKDPEGSGRIYELANYSYSHIRKYLIFVQNKTGAESQGKLTAPVRKIGLNETKKFIRVTVSATCTHKSCMH
jgi:hypothetical protein